MGSRRTRKGRPRRPGARYANGHRKPATPSPKDVAAAMPHRKHLGDKATDPLAETQLGRYALTGNVTQPQLLAGQAYASLWRAYIATLSPPHGVSNANSTGLVCFDCPQDARYCNCAERKRKWLAVHGVINTLARRAQVDQVCLYDRPLINPDLEIASLRIGLDELAAHFGLGLTGQKSSATPKMMVAIAPSAPP